MAGERIPLSYLASILGASVSSLGPTATAGSAPRAAMGRGFFATATPNTAEKRDPKLADVSSLESAIAASEAVSKPLDFDAGVVYIPGAPQNNAGLVRSPENLESFIRQTPEEHKEALMQFVGKPNIPEDKALQLGVKAEEGLAKWWNDKDPRRPVTPTSSAVKKARIGANGDIYVTFGSSPKEYQYKGSSDPVEASRILRDLVAAGSIGRSVNSWSGDWGKAHTYLPKG